MRITAHLGVLDEVELIERAVDHLRAIGVDRIIACDMGSTDGTLEHLERLRDETFELIQLPTHAGWEEWRDTAVDRVKRTPSDWVLFLDADEFWLPASGSLKDCAALDEADIITVDRFNVVLTPTGPVMPSGLSSEDYRHVLVYCRPIADLKRQVEENPAIPWIRGVPMPKVIGRVHAIESVTMGGHDITNAQPMRRTRADDVLIIHVPFSTFARFERRVRNVQRFFSLDETYFHGAQGWHWRRWAALADEGRTVEEFERQITDHSRIADDRGQGIVCSAAELLQQKRVKPLTDPQQGSSDALGPPDLR